MAKSTRVQHECKVKESEMAELLCCGQAELDLKAQMVKELEA